MTSFTVYCKTKMPIATPSRLIFFFLKRNSKADPTVDHGSSFDRSIMETKVVEVLGKQNAILFLMSFQFCLQLRLRCRATKLHVGILKN